MSFLTFRLGDSVFAVPMTTVRVDDQFVNLLDVDKVFSPDELASAEQNIASERK